MRFGALSDFVVRRNPRKRDFRSQGSAPASRRLSLTSRRSAVRSRHRPSQNWPIPGAPLYIEEATGLATEWCRTAKTYPLVATLPGSVVRTSLTGPPESRSPDTSNDSAPNTSRGRAPVQARSVAAQPGPSPSQSPSGVSHCSERNGAPFRPEHRSVDDGSSTPVSSADIGPT